MTAQDSPPPGDLVVLAADVTIEGVVRVLVEERWRDLGLRPMSATILRHPERDPGVRIRAHEVLRHYVRTHRCALAVFDWEGCGDREPPTAVAGKVSRDLRSCGWGDRACAICIAPELEVWVWSDDPAVYQALRASPAECSRLLAAGGHDWRPGRSKPLRPKEAMEHVLRHSNPDRPWSSAIHAEIARTADVTRCSDPAFLELIAFLRRHFPADDPPS